MPDWDCMRVWLYANIRRHNHSRYVYLKARERESLCKDNGLVGIAMLLHLCWCENLPSAH